MTKPIVFNRADIQHRKDGLEDGGTYIKPFVTIRNSESMAGGVNFLKKVSWLTIYYIRIFNIISTFALKFNIKFYLSIFRNFFKAIV